MYSIILSLNMRHNQDRSSRAKCVYAESGIVVPERYQPAEIDTSGALHGFDPAAKLLDEYELVHRDLLAVCAGGFVVRRVAAAWPHVVLQSDRNRRSDAQELSTRAQGQAQQQGDQLESSHRPWKASNASQVVRIG